MNIPLLYELVGIVLLGMGLYSLVMYSHLFRKILALNVSGAGVFWAGCPICRRNQKQKDTGAGYV